MKLRPTILSLIIFSLSIKAKGHNLRFPAYESRNITEAQDTEFHEKGDGMIRGHRCATKTTKGPAKEEVHRFMRDWSLANNGRRLKAINIPVVFHIMHDGKAGNIPQSKIHKQIDVLNKDFRSTSFTFSLVDIERHDNKRYYKNCHKFSTEFDMKLNHAVDPANTLNIYTCSPSDGNIGWTYYPWDFDEDDSFQGVVVKDETLPGGSATPHNRGRTTTHEVGHFLGLYHTFENGCDEPGDEIDDTPFQEAKFFGCPTEHNSCSGTDPIHNFMGYADDDCLNEFTPDQNTRMQNMVAMYKASFLSSKSPRASACLSNGSTCKRNGNCCSEKCKNNQCS
mmetsp:Transcript_19001/g.27873  ORF Transcript_19001/g.27873 Transcript_19001/m.27873 type:complete len:337 (-) Transcript_19001:305-1315(-)